MFTKHMSKIILFFLSGIMAIVCCCNIILGRDGFWGTTITDVLEVFILLFVSYYLVDIKNDANRKKEKIDHAISQAQEKLQDEKLILYGTDNEKNITKVKLKSIGNILELIDKYCGDECKNQIENIKDDMDKLKELVIDNIDDESCMDKFAAHIERLKLTISDKLEGLHLEIG